MNKISLSTAPAESKPQNPNYVNQPRPQAEVVDLFTRVPIWLTGYLDTRGARALRPFAVDILRWSLRSTGACHYPTATKAPGRDSLSSLWGCSERTARNRLGKLRELGVLDIKRQRTPGGWRSELRIVKPADLGQVLEGKKLQGHRQAVADPPATFCRFYKEDKDPLTKIDGRREQRSFSDAASISLGSITAKPEPYPPLPDPLPASQEQEQEKRHESGELTATLEAICESAGLRCDRREAPKRKPQVTQALAAGYTPAELQTALGLVLEDGWAEANGVDPVGHTCRNAANYLRRAGPVAELEPENLGTVPAAASRPELEDPDLSEQLRSVQIARDSACRHQWQPYQRICSCRGRGRARGGCGHPPDDQGDCTNPALWCGELCLDCGAERKAERRPA